MTDFSDLNDSLHDIFPASDNIGTGTFVPKRGSMREAMEKDPAAFWESCPKCRGTGRTRWGACFRCKGKGGKTFKTSTADRAKTRIAAAERRVRTAKENQEAFQTARPEIAAWIAANPRFEFAAKMGEAIAKFGDLTPNQLAACERCIARDKQRAAERQARVENAPAVNVSKIEEAFDAARTKANRPGARGVWVHPLRLQSGETALQFSLGSEGSKWEGMIFVKAGDKKLGTIKGGKFTRRLECSDAEEAAVLDACSDPLKAAIAYGKAWSVCAVCGQTLTNDGSIARGIGPICASKYGWVASASPNGRTA